MTHTPHSWNDPLKCQVGDWIPATADVTRDWDRKKGTYWYRVGGFIRRGGNAAGPVNPSVPWGFEFRHLPGLGGRAWIRSC